MKYLLSSILLSICSVVQAQSENIPLEQKIGQMIMIGFRDTIITDSSHIISDIKTHNIGGVVLYEYDVPTKSRPRNISSKLQLKKLTDDLHELSPTPLFIGIDEEGGKVSRLKTKYGFAPTVSHQYLGTLNNLDTTYFYARRIAKSCKSVGVNLNFAPDVDVNTNPECPVIGKIERSFSSDPETVSKHALAYLEAHQKEGVLCTLKHFPGHGSANMDSHKGFTDVTDSWDALELEPYKYLLAKSSFPMVMTSHVYNKTIDSVYPATLSKATIDMLRHELNYQGLIFSDDMMMLAIADNFGFEEAIKQSINAGVDVLMFSNNIDHYNENIAGQAIKIIANFVKNNEISMNRIEESYKRITLAKQKLYN